MNYLLSLQTLDTRDSREDRDAFASTISTSICFSTASAGAC